MDSKPRLLDLFCGAGGAAMGYHRAGFEVVGVDIKPQPNYPFEFHRAEAIDVLESILNGGHWCYEIGELAAIHASPPCPRYSRISDVHGVRDNHPDLVGPTRDAIFGLTPIPFVIENVPGAPLREPVVLCGSGFGLGANCKDGKWRQLRRHRLFETDIPLMPSPCCHSGEPVGVYGHGGAQRKTTANGGVNRGYMGDKQEASDAMGIDWMTKAELSDAIPPAYTELIGHQLMQHVKAEAVA